METLKLYPEGVQGPVVSVDVADFFIAQYVLKLAETSVHEAVKAAFTLNRFANGS